MLHFVHNCTVHASAAHTFVIRNSVLSLKVNSSSEAPPADEEYWPWPFEVADFLGFEDGDVVVDFEVEPCSLRSRE